MNSLRSLLEMQTLDRTCDTYEQMFDDFVKHAGGKRFEDITTIPANKKNADYYFCLPQYILLVELKQINRFYKAKSLKRFFKSHGIKLSDLNRIERKNLLRNFRPHVARTLGDASAQLRDSKEVLENSGKPIICGALIVNTGDYNMPLELLYYLLHSKAKKEWQNDKYRSLDFLSCISVDMQEEGRNPMQGFHTARPNYTEVCAVAVNWLYSQWLKYYATAIEAKITFTPDPSACHEILEITRPVLGKIRKINQT